jgi:DNA-binding winged helix-turn-helix (wHTH) protein
LRQKVEDDPAAPRLIKTVPNAGYSIDPGGSTVDSNERGAPAGEREG